MPTPERVESRPKPSVRVRRGRLLADTGMLALIETNASNTALLANPEAGAFKDTVGVTEPRASLSQASTPCPVTRDRIGTPLEEILTMLAPKTATLPPCAAGAARSLGPVIGDVVSAMVSAVSAST